MSFTRSLEKLAVKLSTLVSCAVLTVSGTKRWVEYLREVLWHREVGEAGHLLTRVGHQLLVAARSLVRTHLLRVVPRASCVTPEQVTSPTKCARTWFRGPFINLVGFDGERNSFSRRTFIAPQRVLP